MLREYEITKIYSAQTQTDSYQALQEKYEAILFKDGGEIIKKDDWGVKRLAFPIKKQFRGRYVHYDITCSSKAVEECERLMRFDENVLRCLSIRIGENVDVERRKVDIAKAEAKAASSEAEKRRNR